MAPLTLAPDVARRFILGKQGLWPGRRWVGTTGTAQAMRASEFLQLDPLHMVARSQDLHLHSRVVEYTPGLWEALTYGERQFFDWGGWLAVRPMEELPHWRVLMRRERTTDARWREFQHTYAAVIDEMRATVRARGTVSNRDFAMHTRQRTHSYRGRKDSAVALYYLWRMGELMTHHRVRFERVYALAEQVAPAHLLYESSDHDADRFLLKKTVAFYGLHRLASLSAILHRPVSAAEARQWRETLVAAGDLITVQVEGWKPGHYALASDVETLQALEAGRIPAAWQPHDTTTDAEVVFLAPLDVVSARGRAKGLFQFDYVWEVYKPAAQRQWGYYTLPILWGDRLVARLDPKLDRSTNTLVVCGFWLESPHTGRDKAFAEALAAGMARFMRFLGADTLDASAIAPPALRRRVQAVAKPGQAP